MLGVKMLRYSRTCYLWTFNCCSNQIFKEAPSFRCSNVQEGLLSLLDFQMFKCSFGEATFAQGEFIDVSRAPIFKRKLNLLGVFSDILWSMKPLLSPQLSPTNIQCIKSSKAISNNFHLHSCVVQIKIIFDYEMAAFKTFSCC